ncbi:3-dehydroquinate synthase, partial [Micromonospora sp. DH15]|nr:3-dehydroquinate synthase [Micromonospora sp. DH15]
HPRGHARAGATGFRLRHGEAVGVGTVFAGRLAGVLGRIGPERVAEHHEVVAGYGLDPELPSDVDHDELVALMRRDKKATAGLSFVLDGPAGPELVADVPPEAVRTALG